jgi:hypothetical protein
LNDPNLGPAMLTGPPNGSPKKEKKIGTLLGFRSYQRAEAARSSGHARPPQPSGGGAELPVKPGAIRPWGRRRPTSRRGGFVASANSGGGEARRGGPGRGGRGRRNVWVGDTREGGDATVCERDGRIKLRAGMWGPRDSGSGRVMVRCSARAVPVTASPRLPP